MNTFLVGIGLCVAGLCINNVGGTFAVQNGASPETATGFGLIFLIVGGLTVGFAGFRSFSKATDNKKEPEESGRG